MQYSILVTFKFEVIKNNSLVISVFWTDIKIKIKVNYSLNSFTWAIQLGKKFLQRLYKLSQSEVTLFEQKNTLN